MSLLQELVNEVNVELVSVEDLVTLKDLSSEAFLQAEVAGYLTDVRVGLEEKIPIRRCYVSALSLDSGFSPRDLLDRFGHWLGVCWDIDVVELLFELHGYDAFIDAEKRFRRIQADYLEGFKVLLRNCKFRVDRRRSYGSWWHIAFDGEVVEVLKLVKSVRRHYL